MRRHRVDVAAVLPCVVGEGAVRRWLVAVRANVFSLSISGGSDRLFPFKVIWDFFGLWRIWDFSGS